MDIHQLLGGCEKVLGLGWTKETWTVGGKKHFRLVLFRDGIAWFAQISPIDTVVVGLERPINGVVWQISCAGFDVNSAFISLLLGVEKEVAKGTDFSVVAKQVRDTLASKIWGKTTT